MEEKEQKQSFACFAGSLHEGGCELHIKEIARAELTEQHWNIYDADGGKYSWRGSSEMFFSVVSLLVGNFLWKLMKYSRCFKYLKFYLFLPASVSRRKTKKGSENHRTRMETIKIKIHYSVVQVRKRRRVNFYPELI